MGRNMIARRILRRGNRDIIVNHHHSRRLGPSNLRATAMLLNDSNVLGCSKVREFASKGGSSDKKKAMKRQLQNDPASSASGTSTPSSSSSSLQQKATTTPSSGTFSVNDRQGPSFTSMQFSQPSLLLGTPIQAAPLPTTWETDKLSLSALPDDTAALMDKEELFDSSIHLPYAPKDWKGYEPATPLFDFLMSRIGVAGRAITTAEYMRHALTHPSFGYYTNPPSLQEKQGDDFDKDEWEEEEESSSLVSKNESTLIGPRGDFVTAPEISHVFGHCLCVWFVTQWQSPLLNKPEQIQLVELGPGRGTLMSDILQLATSSKLQDFGEAIATVNLVEASRTLREQQENALKERLGHLIEFDFVHVSPFLTMEDKDKKKQEESSSSNSEKKKFQMRIEWHDTFSSFAKNRNKDLPIFTIAQEFLDALPVHSFQKTEDGWRERLIDVASVEDKQPKEDENRPRLRQVLAPDTTPASRLFLENNQQYGHAPVGSVVEICPEGMILVQDLSKVTEESGGVALLIDYGQDGTADTLRAFSNHKQVPLTSQPGKVDVTADVDFFALRNAVKPSNEVSPERQIYAFGPVKQGEFLMRMGAADMVINSIEQDDTSPGQAQKLTDALKYLVMPEHMGEKFKVLALAPKRDGIFAPAGMEN